MATAAILGRGLVFRSGDGATPTEVFATIAEVRDVGNLYPQSLQFEDVTNQDSPAFADEVLPALVQSGETTLEVNYLPGNATQDHVAGVRKDFEDRTLRNYQVRLPGSDALRLAFAAYVTQFPVAVPVQGVMRGNITLRVSGAIVTEADV